MFQQQEFATVISQNLQGNGADMLKDISITLPLKRTTPVIQHTSSIPPQLHPFPQPAITIVTPCLDSAINSDSPAVSAYESKLINGNVPMEPIVERDDAISFVKSGQQKPIAIGLSEIKDQLDRLEENKNSGGMLSWIQNTVKQSNFLSEVANKAKIGMGSVLTTLDPGMKDFFKIENALEVVIFNDNHRIVSAVVDGFRRVFSGLNYQMIGTSDIDKFKPQVVGYELAHKYIDERLFNISNSGFVISDITIVVIQPFLHFIKGKWYDSSIIAAQKSEIKHHVYTQPVPVSDKVITALKAHTPLDYELNAFTTTVGNGYGEVFGVDPDDWQYNILSFSSSELYTMASTVLASLLKQS